MDEEVSIHIMDLFIIYLLLFDLLLSLIACIWLQVKEQPVGTDEIYDYKNVTNRVTIWENIIEPC